MAATKPITEFRLLGHVEAVADGDQVQLGGPKPRALIALLLVEHGRTVTADRLADELWAGNPPGAAETTVRSYVSRLRKALGADMILASHAGYALDTPADSIDAIAFEELARQGEDALRRGAPGAAAERLHAALSLWRGPALSGTYDVPSLLLEARRLEELRLVCLEQRMEADLELGRHTAIVSELQTLVLEEPLRERLRRHLVLALYRCDRQADALDAYRQARDRLVEGLGLEPSEELRELERAILNHELPFVPADLDRHNLPAPSTSFIGREQEAAEIAGLLRNHRLLTLTGIGGAGKTRLAIEVAQRQVGSWGDGVWLVDLAPLTDPQLVVDAVAKAVGAERGDDPLANLIDKAGRSELLVILDNCEHLVDACAEITVAMMRKCPHLRVLATSRVPLRVEGEARFEVDPLSTPIESASPEEIADAASVRLFLERASAIGGDLGRTSDHLETVGRICRELDGLPLSIELTAARAKALSPDQIATHLDDRFRFLSSQMRIVEPRHRTLRAALDWSYELLTADEQNLFCGLSVFAGQFTIAGAAGVCLQGDESQCLELITSLVDASLVGVENDPGSTGGMRYRLLETLREYGADRLAEAGKRPELRRTHAEYYLRLAEAAQLSTEAVGEQRFETVLTEQENLRAAFDWALESDVVLGANLAISLEQLWVANDPFEGMRWFEALRERATDLPPELNARALLAHGGVTFIAGEFERGEQLYESALAEFRRLGEEARAAEVLHRLASARLRTGEHDEARALTMEALGIQHGLGDRRGEAVALGTLGNIAQEEGETDQAVELLEQSATLAGETGFFWWQAGVLLDLGEIAVEVSDFELAEEHLLGTLEVAERIGERQWTIYALALLARTAVEHDALEHAGLLWGAIEAEEQRQPIGQWEAERDDYAAPILVKEGPEFARGRDEGHRLTLEEAVEAALRRS